MKREILYKDLKCPENNFDILFLSPHPDDAEICCGGTISKLAKLGHSVCVVDFTKGEMGSRGTIETRKQEAIDASQIMGIAARINMNFPDSEIGVFERAAQITEVVRLIRELKPKTIFCPFADIRNPDHFNAQNIIEEALFFSNLLKKFPETGAPHLVSHVSYYMMRQKFIPSYVTDISDFIEIKRACIRAHKTQVGLEGTGHDTLVSNPLALSSIDARDAFYGSMIGAHFGEPFFMRGPVSIEDPHKHFSNLAKSSKTFFFDR
jgi:bacillithiol biosynthesis deacetylase BshB1